MARVCRWQVPFMSLDNKKYRVDIYQENYSGNVEVLKGGANPFYTQEDDDEDAFFPIRTSSGYLTVIVENMQLIDDILPNDDHDRYVELIDETDTLNEVCVWNGFLAPDQYSGMWDKTPFELQLPLLSPLAAARGTRFTPTESMTTIHQMLGRIFTNYIEVHPDHFWFAVLDEDTPSMVPFLATVLTDNLFLPEDEDKGRPIFGSNPLPPLKSKCFSAVDVLESFCKAFGYVLYETPKNYYFSAPDKTNVYRKVAWANLDQNGFNLETLSNHQFPTIAGNEHSRVLVPGKSMVRVYCEFDPLEDLYSDDLTYTNVGHSYAFHDFSDRDKEGCIEYLRYSDRFTSWQYENNPQGGHPLPDPVCIQRENRANSRECVGGNWVTYDSTPSPNLSDFTNFEVQGNDALIVATADTDYQGMLFAGEIVSKDKYSAINLQEGLRADFSVRFAKDFRNYSFDDELDDSEFDIYCVLKWGDYFYQYDLGSYRRDAPRPTGPRWSSAYHIFKMTLRSQDKKEYFPFSTYSNGAIFEVSDEFFEYLQGNITLMFYTAAETQGVKMYRVEDIKFSHPIKTPRGRNLNPPDWGLVDYRQSLSVFRLSEYAYKQRLTTQCIAWALAGIEVDEPVTGTSYEQLLLSRLAQWYDRTIEQLSVTVENEDIQPGVRIVRGNAKYIVLSRTVDWRNGQRILTIQRMYDEP